MEAERVAIDPAETQVWFEELAAEVADVPRDFLFNVDETGCSDRTDRREVRINPAREALETVNPCRVHCGRWFSNETFRDRFQDES
jgi:hypothetical protein